MAVSASAAPLLESFPSWQFLTLRTAYVRAWRRIMAATGLANLAQILLNQTTVAQELPAFPAVTAVGAIARATANPSALVDQFVLSSKAGTANEATEAAGL